MAEEEGIEFLKGELALAAAAINVLLDLVCILSEGKRVTKGDLREDLMIRLGTARPEGMKSEEYMRGIGAFKALILDGLLDE